MACHAEASPLELNTALMSAGSWGVVHEPQASGPLNADVLDDTDNVMVNTAMFHAVTFQPQSIQVCACAVLCCAADIACMCSTLCMYNEDSILHQLELRIVTKLKEQSQSLGATDAY